jgi:hypothetical protein
MTRDVACRRDEGSDEDIPESECISWIKPDTLAYCFEKPCSGEFSLYDFLLSTRPREIAM